MGRRQVKEGARASKELMKMFPPEKDDLDPGKLTVPPVGEHSILHMDLEPGKDTPLMDPLGLPKKDLKVDRWPDEDVDLRKQGSVDDFYPEEKTSDILKLLSENYGMQSNGDGKGNVNLYMQGGKPPTEDANFHYVKDLGANVHGSIADNPELWQAVQIALEQIQRAKQYRPVRGDLSDVLSGPKKPPVNPGMFQDNDDILKQVLKEVQQKSIPTARRGGMKFD